MKSGNLFHYKIWILGIILLICGVLILNEFFFISSLVQNIFYFLYIILSILTISILYKQYPIKFHHAFFIPLSLLLMYITFLNHFIALPLLLIYPLFCCSKSNWILKCFSIIIYILLIILMLFTLYIRLIFTSTTIVKEIPSPDNKYMIEVYSIDQGALGGATEVKTARIYGAVFKKERLVYQTKYGKANDIKWIDSTHIEVDGQIIEIVK